MSYEIFVLQWNICSIKCPPMEYLSKTLCFYEIIVLLNVLLWNICPIKCFYEIVVQKIVLLWNICSIKCSPMKYLSKTLCFYEIVVLWKVLLWNICPIKCPSMKYLSNKSPCMKYLSNKMSIYEMFSIKSSYMKYLSNEMSFYEMFFNEMSVHETFVQLNVLLWNICPNEISQKHGFYLISGISTTSAAVSTISTILFSVISKQQTPRKIVCLLYIIQGCIIYNKHLAK